MCRGERNALVYPNLALSASWRFLSRSQSCWRMARADLGDGDGKGIPVGAWGYAHGAPEGAREVRLIGESGDGGDVPEGLAAAEELGRPLDARLALVAVR